MWSTVLKSISGKTSCSRRTNAVVAAAVEGGAGEALEVADAGQCGVDGAVQELPHAVAAQRDGDADGVTFAQFEVGDGFAGVGDDGPLAGDLSDLVGDDIQDASVAEGFPNADVDDDACDAGDLHHAVVAELLFEFALDFFAIALFEAGKGH